MSRTSSNLRIRVSKGRVLSYLAQLSIVTGEALLWLTSLSNQY